MIPKKNTYVRIHKDAYDNAVKRGLESHLPYPNSPYLVHGLYPQNNIDDLLVVLRISPTDLLGLTIVKPTGCWADMYPQYTDTLFEEMTLVKKVFRIICSPDDDTYCDSEHPDEEGLPLFNLPQRQCSVCKRPRR